MVLQDTRQGGGQQGTTSVAARFLLFPFSSFTLVWPGAFGCGESDKRLRLDSKW